MDRVVAVVDHLVINSILLILILMRFSTCFLAVMILALGEMILGPVPISVQIFQAQVQMDSTDFLVQVLVLVQDSANHPDLVLHEIKMGKFDVKILSRIDFNFRFNTGASKQSKGQVEKLEVDLNLTLEELYVGVTKRRKISRKRRQPNGSYVNKENILTIDVKKGWKEGTKITFNGEGDEREGYSAGDVIFVLKVRIIIVDINFIP